MRTLRLCICLLLSGTLLMLCGCKKGGFKVEEVVINNCGANPDTITVHERDQVHWQADDHDYTVRFSDQSEPTSNPFKINHGVSNPAHPIKGHRGCVDEGNGKFYCKYSLTRDNESTTCADPGVHIVP